MSDIINKAVQWAIDIANNNIHGYSQQVRWGPSYDCSSLVISAWEQAGVPVKESGATYTGNMYNAFIKNGFKDVTHSCNLINGDGMKRGDVLLNTANHTAMYIGDCQLVHARSSEGTYDTIDNSGNEIRTQKYFNYPWNYVLRFDCVNEEDNDAFIFEPLLNKRGLGIAMIQGGLKFLKYDLGKYGIDGDSGGLQSYTNTALKSVLLSNRIPIYIINLLKEIK